ncbi:MAG: sugar phosphate isomerase/epimerase [Asgard group archaeon]|nr:sugar phosphate isomerase/epimerase [Asgard group archaeon]
MCLVMKIGVTIEPYEGIPAGYLVPFAHAISLDHIEINVNIFPDIDGVLEKIEKLTTTFHLPIFFVEGYGPGTKGKKYEKKMAKVISFINEYHKDLNMLYTLAHPPESENETFDLLIERLQQINTPIVLENIPWQSDDDFIEFYFQAKDILGKQLAGHAIDAAHRFLTYQDDWLNVPEELTKEIVYVHLQDTSRKKDDHLPLGQGEMPYKDFLHFLKKNGFKGVINQEIKPKGLDLVSIMDSCLEILKVVNKARFLRLKAKYTILTPILKRKIKQAAEARKV